MPHLEEALLESEEFLTEYSVKYPAALSVYEQIIHIVDSALEHSDRETLLSLISFIESEEGYPVFQYISEARYLFRILNILALEEKYGLIPFSCNIHSKQDLIRKYNLSLFSLRRILFALSEDSIVEAEDFLSKNPLSPFAIYIMSKEELICPNSLFFQNIEGLYNPLWNDMEIQLFRQLVTTFTEAT